MIVCEHGSLKRSCEICERDEEIALLREELTRLRDEVRGILSLGVEEVIGNTNAQVLRELVEKDGDA